MGRLLEVLSTQLVCKPLSHMIYFSMSPFLRPRVRCSQTLGGNPEQHLEIACKCIKHVRRGDEKDTAKVSSPKERMNRLLVAMVSDFTVAVTAEV